MHSFINSPFTIGKLQLPHRLIQGPLAGYSCAPFRQLFSQFTAPAYCVTEMLSAHEVVHRDRPDCRFLYRAAEEDILCYQLAGHDPQIMAEAAQKLEALGADAIDINCGCPKRKIRKKGAGSALLETPERLSQIVQQVKANIQIPLTVKIRLHGVDHSLALAQRIADSGADALIVHGRFIGEDYEVAVRLDAIGRIKQALDIPVIANGDIRCRHSLEQAWKISGADAFMIGRAGTGCPWLYQELLSGNILSVSLQHHVQLFLDHIEALACLENEVKAVMQSKSLLRYYFKHKFTKENIREGTNAQSLAELREMLMRLCEIPCIM